MFLFIYHNSLHRPVLCRLCGTMEKYFNFFRRAIFHHWCPWPPGCFCQGCPTQLQKGTKMKTLVQSTGWFQLMLSIFCWLQVHQQQFHLSWLTFSWDLSKSKSKTSEKSNRFSGFKVCQLSWEVCSKWKQCKLSLTCFTCMFYFPPTVTFEEQSSFSRFIISTSYFHFLVTGKKWVKIMDGFKGQGQRSPFSLNSSNLINI